MHIKHTLPAIALAVALASPQAEAAKKATAPAGGKAISPELIGIFFEDINYSADGGLWGELIQNGSFEFSPSDNNGWGPGTAWRTVCHGHSTGYIEPLTQAPLNARNPHYMRIFTERAQQFKDFRGMLGVGVRNDGFDGIAVKAGGTLNFSLFMRAAKGQTMPVRVMLLGAKNKILAEATLSADGDVWKKHSATLTPSEDCANAAIEVVATAVGTLDVDMLSLMPADTYKGHGLRKDLAETLAALQPKFVRFPGGCVVHGGGCGFWNTYRWKNTVGPREERIGQKNAWGYHQSVGLGYYEYFQFCEDLGAAPLPILPVGVSCQGAGGGWGMGGACQMAKPMSEMQEWIDDALDLIEWANGPATSKWGKIRAEAGHPKPFGLKYLGLGNEEYISPAFEERFKLMYKAIKEKHPEIIIVGTAGPGSHKGNPDYDNGWRIAEETGLDIIDEHYYEKREYFYNNQHNYDAYPRDRKTRVYLGEYAAKDKKLTDALAEALYLLGCERNGDVVAMTSYAPLLAKKNHTQWNPDLIYFDNERVFPTCSYYVQQMFGTTAGNWYYGDVARFAATDKYLGTSCVLNTKKGEIYVKYVNATDKATPVAIDLSRFASLPKTARIETISGTPDTENNYEQQPLAPVAQTVKLTKRMSREAAPYSCNVLRIKLR